MQTEANAGGAAGASDGPVSDADLAAELRALREGAGKDGGEAAKKPEAAAAAKKPAAGEGDEDEDGGSDVEEEAESKTEDDDAGDEDEDGKKEPEVKLDDETKKRLAAVQHREKKHNERVAADTAKFEALRKEWEPKFEAAQKFEALKGKGIAGLLEAADHFGVKGDDFEHAARALYARSPAAAKDPKTRAAAEDVTWRRTMEQRVAAAEEKAAAAEKQLVERDQQAKVQARVDAYLGGIEKHAKTAPKEGQADPAPLVRKLVETAPAKARALFHQVAVELLDATGATPSAADVVAEVEKRRRADLAEMGIDPAAVLGAAAAAKDGATVEKKKPSKTLGNAGAGTAAAQPKPKTGRELDAEVEAELRALRRSGSVSS